MKRPLIIFFMMLFSSLAVFPQGEDPCVQAMDKRVEKEFKKARALQQSGKKAEAYEIYESLLLEEPYSLDLNYYYALGYYLPIERDQFVIANRQQAQQALEAFHRIYTICPYYKIQHNLYAARIAFFMEKYHDAVKFAKVLTENPDLVKNLDHLDEAQVIIKQSSFFSNVLSNPVPFNPKPVEGISTTHDEYLATLSPDGEQFYFTRRQPVSISANYFSDTKEEREYFCISKQDKNRKFGIGGPLPYPFNQASNEGSPTINMVNDLLIFAKMTPVKLGAQTYPNYDLYYSELIDGYWSDPQSLGNKVNRNDSWESQPSLSSDGNLLFFASDRPGGYGGSDIWVTEKDADGGWKSPVNLGPKINTKGNERSPFLHTDSKTLYFSSSGHPGLGGLDIYYAKTDAQGYWQTPVNIGYPINSEKDEVDFFVSLDGKTAYFSSNNIESDDWNIYEFELYEAARPTSMLIVKGEVSADEEDLSGAVVEIRDTSSKIIARARVNERTGKYAIATELNEKKPEEFIINVKKEGYSFDTKLVKPEQIINNVVTNDAEVKKIEPGKTYNLHDIYYGTNLYSLTPRSKRVIDLFVEFLRENPSVKVEIQGHTDDVGDDKTNRVLSENRARSVYEYVISKNVDKARLRYKGYGKDQPVAPNHTPEGRAKNRRTVFLIYEN